MSSEGPDRSAPDQGVGVDESAWDDVNGGSSASHPSVSGRSQPRIGRAIAKAPAVLLAAAIAGLVLWGLSTDGYFTLDNLRAVLASMAVVGIVGVGMTAITVSGALASLSLGTTAAVGAMVFMQALQVGIVGAILLTLLFGLVVVGIQGALIGGFEANPIVLTIAAGGLQMGVATAVTGGAIISPSGSGFAFLNGKIGPVPVAAIIAIGFALIVEFGLRRTVLGQQMILAGSSRPAARAAGLPLMRIGAAAFAIGGIGAAMAGILLAASNRQGSFLLEGTLTFDAIAATLVGGTAISGGSGSPIATMLGAFLIAAISDLLLLNSFSAGGQVLIKGLIVIAVVLIVHYRNREGV